MNKNYKEWADKIYGKGNHPAVNTARILTKKGWLACKREVLEILNKNGIAKHELLNSGELQDIENL